MPAARWSEGYPDEIVLNVGQEFIDMGIRRRKRHCPVAKALEDMVSTLNLPVAKISVMYGKMVLYPKEYGYEGAVYYEPDSAVQRFIDQFDGGKEMTPTVMKYIRGQSNDA